MLLSSSKHTLGNGFAVHMEGAQVLVVLAIFCVWLDWEKTSCICCSFGSMIAGAGTR